MHSAVGFVKTNDGVRLYCEDSGIGRPIVLIHGGAMSLRWWQKQVPVLAESFRVIALDMRGCGRSDKPAWGYRIARYAKDVYDVLETLGLYDVALVGWSMGARTILAYVELFGGRRVRSLVLVDETPSIDLHLPPRPQTGKSETPHSDEPPYFRQMILEMFAPQNAANVTEDDLAWMMAEGRRLPIEARSALAAEYRVQDWRPLLPTIDIPTLITTGRNSGAYPGCVYMAQHIPGA